MINDMDIVGIAENIGNHICVDELRGLEIVKDSKDSFILPNAGNNSFVFKAKVNGKTVAMRLFRQSRKSVNKRYPFIENKIKSSRSRYVNRLLYFEKGVWLNSSYYPIIISDWIDGINLLAYCEKDKCDIKRLIFSVESAFFELSSMQLGHGDIQHDNIFVSPVGDVRLFDLDGCYFEEIKDYAPREFGSPNYTHPERIKKKIYDANIDEFSKWVLYLSLLVLLENKALIEFGRRDGLLFTADDFNKPGESEILKYLCSSNNMKLKRIGDFISKISNGQYADVPAFSIKSLSELKFIKGTKIARLIKQAGMPAWISSGVERFSRFGPTIVNPSSDASVRPSWLMQDSLPVTIAESEKRGHESSIPSWLNIEKEAKKPVIIVRSKEK